MVDAKFESEAHLLYRQIMSGGVDKLNQEGFRIRKFEDLKGLSRRGLKIFLRSCHYEFNAAQNRIAGLMIDIIREKRAVEEQIRDARVAKDSEKQKEREQERDRLQRQTLLLRRLLDCVLGHFIGDQGWILRHLMVYQEIRDIDPDVLDATGQEANRRNRQNRMAFHLVTDLLTAVHVGDLIKVDRSDITKEMKPGDWEVIELKAGAVNDTLGNLLTKHSQQQVPQEEIKQIGNELGAKGLRQFERMVRQRTRQQRVETIIRTDQGVEPILETPMRLIEPGDDYDDYFHVIRKICEQLPTEETVMYRYEECLYFIGITQGALNRFGMRRVVHQFFHMRNPSQECALTGSGSVEGIDREFSELARMPQIVDLVEANFRSGWGRSIFEWPMDDDSRFTLAFEKYRIFLLIDYEQLFKMADRDKGIALEWIPANLKGVKGAEREMLSKLSGIVVGSPGARGAAASRGDVHRQVLMSGFFHRIVIELMAPRYWLELLDRTIIRAADHFSAPKSDQHFSA